LADEKASARCRLKGRAVGRSAKAVGRGLTNGNAPTGNTGRGIQSKSPVVDAGPPLDRQREGIVLSETRGTMGDSAAIYLLQIGKTKRG